MVDFNSSWTLSHSAFDESHCVKAFLLEADHTLVDGILEEAGECLALLLTLGLGICGRWPLSVVFSFTFPMILMNE